MSRRCELCENDQLPTAHICGPHFEEFMDAPEGYDAFIARKRAEQAAAELLRGVVTCCFCSSSVDSCYAWLHTDGEGRMYCSQACAEAANPPKRIEQDVSGDLFADKLRVAAIAGLLRFSGEINSKGGTVHPAHCSECRAPLRPEQIHRHRLGTDDKAYCAYCQLRTVYMGKLDERYNVVRHEALRRYNARVADKLDAPLDHQLEIAAIASAAITRAIVGQQLEPAPPKLTPCSECRAPLRPEQIHRHRLGTDDKAYCAYCQLRTVYMGKLDERYNVVQLDERIAQYEPSEPPRDPADWDVWSNPSHES